MQYNVTIELDRSLTDDEADELTTALDPYHGGVMPNRWGTEDIVLTIEAENARGLAPIAASLAEVVESRVPAVAVGVSLLPTELWDARLTTEVEAAGPPYLSSVEAGEALGFSKVRIHQLIAEGALPYIRIGRTVGVPQASVRAFLAAKAR